MLPTHRLDVLGHLCPVPVAETRKALEGLNPGNILEILCDDPETVHDIPLLISRLGQNILDIKESSGEFHFLVEVII